jgi:hypothetical protein
VPIAVEHDERRRWIIAIASGVLTLADVITLIRTARASVEYRMWPMLVDAQTATTDMTEADVERTVEAIQRGSSRRTAGTRRAGGARRYRLRAPAAVRDALRGHRHAKRPRQRPDAERWLALLSGARNSVEGSGYRAGHGPLAGRHPSTSMNA